MNNYKERYALLEKDISEIKNTKQKLEQLIMVEGMKLEAENMKISVLDTELMDLKYDRNQIIRSKDKTIDLISNILLTALLIGTPMLEIIIYNIIFPVGILKIALTVLCLLSGGATFFTFSFALIKNIEEWLRKKYTSKNANKKECIELTKKIQIKDKELSEERKIQKQIKEEVDRLSNEIKAQKELLSSKQYEVAKLFEEIVISAINVVPAVVPAPEEILAQTQAKPKTKVKMPENK